MVRNAIGCVSIDGADSEWLRFDELLVHIIDNPKNDDTALQADFHDLYSDELFVDWQDNVFDDPNTCRRIKANAFELLTTYILSRLVSSFTSGTLAEKTPLVDNWIIWYKNRKLSNGEIKYRNLNTNIGLKNYLGEASRAPGTYSLVLCISTPQLHRADGVQNFTSSNAAHFQNGPPIVMIGHDGRHPAGYSADSPFSSNLVVATLPDNAADPSHSVLALYNAHHDPGKLICGEDLVEFHYSLNGSAMVQKYNVDPYTMSNVVLCDGRVYTAKEFIKRRACTNVPPMTDTSAAGVRRWYKAFTKHCNSHGIYIHPYALFQKGYGETKGFKAGGDSSDDLPIQFVLRIVSHSLVISTMISGKDVIPAKSIYASLQDNACGDGYCYCPTQTSCICRHQDAIHLFCTK